MLVGDIHGQLDDLYYVMRNGGSPPSTNYLFLGDYVDRGEQGIEVLMITLVLKLQFPDRVFLLRGNHESQNMTQQYGFKEECLKKYDQEVLSLIWAVFNKLPLAAVVNGVFFCVHGGLSPELQDFKNLNNMKKMEQDIPGVGMMCDLMWSDPTNMMLGDQLYIPNYDRKCSYSFGPKAVRNFLDANQVLTIIRAHQCVKPGYECHTWGSEFPLVITIFSAENYERENMGAFMTIKVS